MDQLVIDIIFLCKYHSGVPKCKSFKEVSKIYWMTEQEIINNNNSPIWLKESIKNK